MARFAGRKTLAEKMTLDFLRVHKIEFKLLYQIVDKPYYRIVPEREGLTSEFNRVLPVPRQETIISTEGTMVNISSLMTSYSRLKTGMTKTATTAEKGAVPGKEAAKYGNVKVVSMEFRLDVGGTSSTGFGDQAGIFKRGNGEEVDLTSLYSSLYSKEPPTTVEEARELVSEDGFFGVKKTSSRIADFVIGAAGDDIEKLREGRKGILRGFEEAEKAWGGELPTISHETLSEAIGMVDERIGELGGSILDTSG